MRVPADDRRFDTSERVDLGLARAGAWDWDPGSQTLLTSSRCRQLLHLRHREVTAADVAAVIHPEDLPRLLNTSKRCLSGEAECRAEFRVRNDTGWRWVEAAGRLLRRAGEPTGHVVGILTDITERKRAEDEREFWQRRTHDALTELERTAHHTSDLLRGASHDLRTPLNAVLGWCHILGSQTDRPDQVRHVVEVIERNAWALAGIIDNMARQARGLSDGSAVAGGAAVPAVTRPAPPALQTEPLAGLRVLVVDDDRDSREFVRRVLLHAGAEVDEAANCADGLDVFVRRPPDVVVSDIDLPDQDGYALLRVLRSRQNGQIVPAVAVTALARPADAAAALEAGFQVHLAKPVRPGDLCAAIRRLVPLTPAGRASQAAPDDVDVVPPGRLTP